MTSEFVIASLALVALVGSMASGDRAVTGLPQERYLYTAIDGDTLSRVDLEHPDRRRLIRVYGLDTPEIKLAKCVEEKRAGYLAKARLQELIVRRLVTLEPVKKRDKYGRLLARVFVGKQDVADILIREGYGRAYSGKGRRKGWC